MPKEIPSYFQCDKDDGKLMKFASTCHSFGLACGDGGENAEFWICPECYSVYYRHRYSSGSYLGDDPDTYSALTLFSFQATPEELRQLAEACLGYYNTYNDDRIVKTRSEKLSILNRLESSLKQLKNLSTISLAGKWTVDEEPKEVGKDGLCVVIVVNTSRDKEKYAWCKKDAGICKGDEVLVITEKINFAPSDMQECYFAFK